MVVPPPYHVLHQCWVPPISLHLFPTHSYSPERQENHPRQQTRLRSCLSLNQGPEVGLLDPADQASDSGLCVAPGKSHPLSPSQRQGTGMSPGHLQFSSL